MPLGRLPKVVLSLNASVLPLAPEPKLWSMTYLPSVRLEFASPSGNVAFFEFRSSRIDSIVDAQRKTMRDVNSVSWRVSALMTRTPVARPSLGSYSTSATMLFGSNVRLPVARAAGSVAAMLLKYELVMHPFSHGP